MGANVHGANNNFGEQAALKFFVVDDASPDKTFRYSVDGPSGVTSNQNAFNTAPRGIASNSTGTKTWVIDDNDKVYVYDAAGVLQGSWLANGLTTPEGIATDGTNIWIVDAGSDKVFKYNNAASRTSGNQNAAFSFSLNNANVTPKDIVTNGTHLWVVNDSSTDKVFKYTVGGSLVGSWSIDSSNSSPTGITIDPTNLSDVWIVDSYQDKVYRYAAAASRTSGSQNAASNFALASGNANPQGIADPRPLIDGVWAGDAPVVERGGKVIFAPTANRSDGHRLAATRTVRPRAGEPIAALRRTTASADGATAEVTTSAVDEFFSSYRGSSHRRTPQRADLPSDQLIDERSETTTHGGMRVGLPFGER